MKVSRQYQNKQGILHCVGLECWVMVDIGGMALHKLKITTNLKTISPKQGIISSESPLGKSLLGKPVGSSLAYYVGKRQFKGQILAIE